MSGCRWQGLTLALEAGVEGSALLFWVEVTWRDKHPSGQYNLDGVPTEMGGVGVAVESGMGVGDGLRGRGRWSVGVNS